MIQIILFMVFIIIMGIAFITFIITGGIFIIFNRKGNLSVKCLGVMKKTGLLIGIMIVMIGGLFLVSKFVTRTPAILDEQNKIREGSVAELKMITLNGRKEWISIRGENKNNPIILFLAGGPGGSQMAAVRHELGELEKNFVVVNWDQPGSGKSYGIAPKDMTVDTYIEDGVALTNYLCERFGQDKIYLVGESWGSALAIFLAERQPESYKAVIGTGQMVDFLETELQDYDKAMEIAEERGDTDKIAKLKANGRPPYYGEDVTWKSAEYLNYLSDYMTKDPNIANSGYQTFRDIFSEEYSLKDKINYFRGIVTTFNSVYPQLYDVDLRTQYSKLEVPVYFFVGRHDINAPTSLVEEYADVLVAPYKEIIWFEQSGHSPWINESDKFVEELIAIRDRWK